MTNKAGPKCTSLAHLATFVPPAWHQPVVPSSLTLSFSQQHALVYPFFHSAIFFSVSQKSKKNLLVKNCICFFPFLYGVLCHMCRCAGVWVVERSSGERTTTRLSTSIPTRKSLLSSSRAAGSTASAQSLGLAPRGHLLILRSRTAAAAATATTTAAVVPEATAKDGVRPVRADFGKRSTLGRRSTKLPSRPWLTVPGYDNRICMLSVYFLLLAVGCSLPREDDKI